jgi:hypothetical protein
MTDVGIDSPSGVARCPTDVRYWGQSGHDAEVTRCPLMTLCDVGVPKLLPCKLSAAVRREAEEDWGR